MSDHAKLSPSAAERWMTCPGSVVLSEGMPSKSSAFADEGTEAHSMAETILNGGQLPADVIESEMFDNVMVYVDHVQGIAGKLHVEVRVKVTDQIWGTADAVIWSPTDAVLYVRDLKFGAGVAVEATDNLQLKIYALAALLTMGYPAKTVDVGIVQPRCPHSDGPVRTVRFDVVELLDFHADLLDAVARVEGARCSGGRVEFQTYLAPSEKGCRWCLAAPKCPALKSKAQDLAKQVFAPGLPYDPKALADTLDFLPILEGWIKNTREFAYGEAEKGNDIPQWKLVEKRATRKWRMDESVVASRLVEGSSTLTADNLYERKFITPAAVEKLLAKEERGLLDELTIKESSGHTLVHESDKRPAVKLDAASAFSSM